MTDMPYRTMISLHLSLSINLIYAVFRLLAGIHYASFWYGADAVFYIALSAIRVLLLRHVHYQDGGIVKEYQRYRFCGFLLIILNVAFISVVYQVVNHDMGYQYPGLMIYVMAYYAFFCLILAIINYVKYRKLNSPVLFAAKAISLVRALVAIFALQTAMLISFGGEERENISKMNNVTGACVCVFIGCMAVYMIVRANKNLKKLSESGSI